MENENLRLNLPVDIDARLIDATGNRIDFPDSRCGFSMEISENKDYFTNDDRVRLYGVLATCKPSENLLLRSFSIMLSHTAGSNDAWNGFKDGLHWIPNIKTQKKDLAGDHVFRSPAVIFTVEGGTLAAIPDLKALGKKKMTDHFLDLEYDENLMSVTAAYGMRSVMPRDHVYYTPDDGPFVAGCGGISLSFHVMTFNDMPKHEIMRLVSRFEWEMFSAGYAGELLPQTIPFIDYAAYGYGIALGNFWRKGPVEGSGGITLSTFRISEGVYRGREYADDLWFHSWFNNLRTAYGLYSYGVSTGDGDWMEKARSIAACLLAAPSESGVFPTIYAPQENSWVASSRQGGGPGLYSIPDCAWTAIWLRKFENGLEHMGGAEELLTGFKNFLLAAQSDSGGFPCWVDENLCPDSRLDHSASGALALWFLGEELLASGNPDEKVLACIRSGSDFLIREVLPFQKFEDFELYYSCSAKPLDFYDPFTRSYSQNTLAIQWCAEAMRVACLLTGDERYYNAGIYCISLLCMYQQVWNPPYLSLYAFGGFGVMNTDAEWNDARQAQFAVTLADFYDLTGDFMYFERAVAAARAAFALMAIPENRDVCPNNYRGTDMFSETVGGSAENYGHAGYDARSYQSGFHWGTGSALTTAAVLTGRYGDLYIDLKHRKAAGVDGVAVKQSVFNYPVVELEIDVLSRKTSIEIAVSDEYVDGLQLKVEGYRISKTGKPCRFTAERVPETGF